MKRCTRGDCGQPKKPGHPLWCADHYLLRRTMALQIADAQQAREAAPPGGLKRPPRADWPDGKAWCGGCYRMRLQAFFAGDATQCRPCISEKTHARHTEKTYGVGPGEYNRMAAEQGGKCAICRKRQVRQRLAVHHDHRDGAVLGLLCKRCNHDLLGGAFDSPHMLLRAYALQTGGWPAVQWVLDHGDVHWAPWAELPAFVP